MSMPTDNSIPVADGWYVATIVFEDFPKSNITMGRVEYSTQDALSLVPIQVTPAVFVVQYINHLGNPSYILENLFCKLASMINPRLNKSNF